MQTGWGRYFGFTRGRRWLLALAVIAAAGRGVALALLATRLRVFVAAAQNRDLDFLFLNVAMAVGLVILAAALSLVAPRLTALVIKPVVSRIRLQLVDVVLAMPTARLHEIGRGRLQSILTEDTARIDRGGALLVGNILPAVMSSAMLVLMLLHISPTFGAACVLISGAIFAFARLFRRLTRKPIAAFQDAAGEFARGGLLTLERIDLAHASAAEPFERRQRGGEIDVLEQTGHRMQMRMTLVGETHALLNNLALIAFVVAGSLAVRMTNGSYDLLTVFLVLMLLRSQVSIVVAALPEVDQARQALARADALIAAVAPSAYGGQERIWFRGDVRFEGVSFSYDGKPFLAQMDLNLTPGECVALRGANGAGKTTVVGLILGLLKPTAGQVLAQGKPYAELDLADLRGQIALVPQEASLFTGSVTENIAYGQAEASPTQIAAAAKAAGAAEFIAGLPQGYQTLIGENGAFLSGGQRQRIALARALLRRPSLLILDEPTNHLDADAVAHLLQTIRRLEGKPTVLIISHSDEVLDIVDRVVVLAEGRLTSARGDLMQILRQKP